MVLPKGNEYDLAIQNPKISFNDADLRLCAVETTPLGLPKPYSGGFTITYKLYNSNKAWAVRCFHRDISDLQKRYQIIGKFISNSNSKYFVEANYLSDGIKVNGKFYPIIKMQWLEGDPLNIYIIKNLTQKTKIEKILNDFVNLINELERFGIAHGDLQHGNIIVKNDSLHLIDYDGMYLPELATLKSNEIGHINYQHPKRSSSHYNQYIDRFSALVIYIGIKAITINPKLWKLYDNSENILFKSKDFVDFENSPLIKELSDISEIKPLVEKFVECCRLEIEKVPSLNDFLKGNFTNKISTRNINKPSEDTILINRSQYPILDGTNIDNILEHFGEKVEVIGKIVEIKSFIKKFKNSALGVPCTFLNFGKAWPNQTFTIVIWKEGLISLKEKGINLSFLEGKWVSITGVITKYGDKPQIIVDLASQIQLLSSEDEAKQKLGIKKTLTSLITKHKIPPIIDSPFSPLLPNNSPITNINDLLQNKTNIKIFNELYDNVPIIPLTKDNKNSKFDNPYPPSQFFPSPNNTVKLSNSNLKNNENKKFIIPIIFAITGALIIVLFLDSTYWFLGIICGLLVGVIYNKFKS